MPEGYDTPEEAAMEGFPPQYCRVIATRIEDDEAFVLLDTGSAGQPYYYGCNCIRTDGRWFEDSSSNMQWGWSQRTENPELGTLVVWGEAPEEAVAVYLAFGHTVIEEPIMNGVYLAMRLNVPNVSEWPQERFVFRDS